MHFQCPSSNLSNLRNLSMLIYIYDAQQEIVDIDRQTETVCSLLPSGGGHAEEKALAFFSAAEAWRVCAGLAHRRGRPLIAVPIIISELLASIDAPQREEAEDWPPEVVSVDVHVLNKKVWLTRVVEKSAHVAHISRVYTEHVFLFALGVARCHRLTIELEQVHVRILHLLVAQLLRLLVRDHQPVVLRDEAAGWNGDRAAHGPLASGRIRTELSAEELKRQEDATLHHAICAVYPAAALIVALEDSHVDLCGHAHPPCSPVVRHAPRRGAREEGSD
mmetsp:Transcript_42960/g.100793  ORF Transcript_42960/g.100793 Transcript_42960/m.100793 type:complete len:277 (-) Transcript_42960:2655-3485(-)